MLCRPPDYCCYPYPPTLLSFIVLPANTCFTLTQWKTYCSCNSVEFILLTGQSVTYYSLAFMRLFFLLCPLSFSTFLHFIFVVVVLHLLERTSILSDIFVFFFLSVCSLKVLITVADSFFLQFSATAVRIRKQKRHFLLIPFIWVFINPHNVYLVLSHDT